MYIYLIPQALIIVPIEFCCVLITFTALLRVTGIWRNFQDITGALILPHSYQLLRYLLFNIFTYILRNVKSSLRANACTAIGASVPHDSFRQTSAEYVRLRAFSHYAPTNLTLLHSAWSAQPIPLSFFANSFDALTLLFWSTLSSSFQRRYHSRDHVPSLILITPISHDSRPFRIAD